MSEMVEKKIFGDSLELRVYLDECGINPRKDFDNLSIMAFFHNRYSLGDGGDIHGLNAKDFAGWDEMESEIIKRFNPVIIKPVFMYDHSGITISLGQFHDHWDSGQIGFVFIPKDKALKEYSVKRISPKIKAKCLAIIESEIEVYDYYLRGEICGYELVKVNPVSFKELGNTESTEDILDSCWGFYGLDIEKNGIMDHIGDFLPKTE